MEERRPYSVIRRLTAYRDHDEGFGYALDEISIKVGEPVFADLVFWEGKTWEGFEVVKFTWGPQWYYSKRSNFEQSTQPIQTHGK
jgi:hypothetical protein